MEHARALPVRLGTFLVNRAPTFAGRLGFHEIGRTEVHILFE
jgi:hypothetical protein